MLQPQVTSADAATIEESSGKAFDLGLIVMIVMIMIYFGFETLKH